MASKHDLSPSDQNNKNVLFKDRMSVKIAAGLLAASTALGISSCKGEEVSAKPQPSETSTSVPATPEPTKTIQPTPEATTQTPTPTETPTTAETQPANVEIEPFRDWKIDEEMLPDLQAHNGNPQAQWAILKQFIEDNNKGAGYFGNYGGANGDIIQNNTIEPTKLAERTFLEIATMADLAKDPTVKDGVEIASIWAHLAFVFPEDADNFIETMAGLRKYFLGPDSEEFLIHDKSEPRHHYSKSVYDGGINNFNFDGEEYTGATFLVLEELHNDPETGLPKAIEKRNFGHLTVVFDNSVMATRILRLKGLDGDNPTINFTPGVPTDVNSLPEYQAELGERQ